ncbi:MAG: polyphosphate polymerase domain-containing protein [Caldilineaceae bacterium]|nr:polyphosphate polymerase domain-containing protein [Caldilineaceae bacterium]
MMNQLSSFAPSQPRPASPVFPGDSMTFLERLMGRFDPISLKEMDDVALLDRTDTKYVLQTGQLQQALAQLTDQYRVLTIQGNRLNHYQTVYFDTPGFALYKRHHDGSHSRYKVRSREYVDSHLAFLEVKFKTNKNRTIKSRMQTPDVVTEFDRGTSDFVHAHYPDDPAVLEPKLWNQFIRITLVSKQNVERLTLDVNLEFERDRARAGMPGIAIAEVKQDGFNIQSDFIRQMRKMGVRPSGFSKYCMGVATLYDEVKKNNFKPRMLHVGKLMHGEILQ